MTNNKLDISKRLTYALMDVLNELKSKDRREYLRIKRKITSNGLDLSELGSEGIIRITDFSFDYPTKTQNQ